MGWCHYMRSTKQSKKLRFSKFSGILKDLRILIFKASYTSQDRTYENAIWQHLFCYQGLYTDVSTKMVNKFAKLQ